MTRFDCNGEISTFSVIVSFSLRRESSGSCSSIKSAYQPLRARNSTSTSTPPYHHSSAMPSPDVVYDSVPHISDFSIDGVESPADASKRRRKIILDAMASTSSVSYRRTTQAKKGVGSSSSTVSGSSRLSRSPQRPSTRSSKDGDSGEGDYATTDDDERSVFSSAKSIGSRVRFLDRPIFPTTGDDLNEILIIDETRDSVGGSPSVSTMIASRSAPQLARLEAAERAAAEAKKKRKRISALRRKLRGMKSSGAPSSSGSRGGRRRSERKQHKRTGSDETAVLRMPSRVLGGKGSGGEGERGGGMIRRDSEAVSIKTATTLDLSDVEAGWGGDAVSPIAEKAAATNLQPPSQMDVDRVSSLHFFSSAPAETYDDAAESIRHKSNRRSSQTRIATGNMNWEDILQQEAEEAGLDLKDVAGGRFATATTGDGGGGEQLLRQGYH